MKKSFFKKSTLIIMQPVKWLFIGLSLLIGVQIFLKTFEYYQPDFTHGFLKGKKDIFYSVYQYGFYAHIVSAPLILFTFTGALQFIKILRQKFPKFHRVLGYIYVIAILFLAAPGGLIMGFYAIGGIGAILSFMILTPLWWFYTWKAYLYAKKGNFVMHGLYMRRSIILTLSAVFLRIYAFIALWFFHDNSHNTYILISWLSWLPNLILFELWWRKYGSKQLSDTSIALPEEK